MNKKIQKKKIRLQDEIDRLEHEMEMNLGKKTSDTPEISISDYLIKIDKLRMELIMLS